jgi:hypothetical protein
MFFQIAYITRSHFFSIDEPEKRKKFFKHNIIIETQILPLIGQVTIPTSSIHTVHRFTTTQIRLISRNCFILYRAFFYSFASKNSNFSLKNLREIITRKDLLTRISGLALEIKGTSLREKWVELRQPEHRLPYLTGFFCSFSAKWQ